jgi:hypothetical protein
VQQSAQTNSWRTGDITEPWAAESIRFSCVVFSDVNYVSGVYAGTPSVAP